MTIVISNKILTYLAAAIAAGDDRISIGAQDYSQVFEAGQGDVYVILRGPSAREIVKVDIDNSVYGSYLSVARGQGGSIAAAWPMGTKIFGSTNADHYNSILQAGETRTIDYNPNEILTPLYAGEKVYQNGPAGCLRWWKAYNAVNPYWDLITGVACLTEAYQDIGWDYDLLIPVIPPTQVLTVYAEDGDGYVGAWDAVWATARAKATGDETNPNATNQAVAASAYLLGGPLYFIGRTFFEFDLTGFTETGRDITKIELDLAPYGNVESDIMIFGSAFTGDVAVADFDDFLTTDFLDTPFELEMWDGGNYKRNIMLLNSAGETYAKNKFDGKVAFCIREHAHDVLNVAPVALDNRNGFWFIDIGYTDPIRTPRLVITYTKLPDWTEIHNNTNWSPDNDATWDGTKWLSGTFDVIDLQAIGTWMNGWKPFKLRLEFTGTNTVWVDLYNTQGSGSLTDGNELFTNGEEKIIVNYNNLDLDFLVISNYESGPFSVENIEFLEP